MCDIEKLCEKYELQALKEIVADLTAEQRELVTALLNAEQQHIFQDWETTVDKDDKLNLISELLELNAAYPGGLTVYIENAKKLLADAKAGKNAFDGFQPEQPDLIDLTNFNDNYLKFEAIGTEAIHNAGFVLVAGGLGERLGYSGIKLDIPVEVVELTSYFKLYATSIKSLQNKYKIEKPIPFIIMTSEDTYQGTLDTLDKENYFGLDKDQFYVLKQELVPAISGNNGHIALNGKYSVAKKPHGHGDIHMLLHTSGIAKKLYNDGYKHLIFIQDTNGQVFNAVLPALGVSVEQEYDFNSLAVNRIPGEAVGALAKLVNGDKSMTLNVEYNMLEPLLKATVSPEGDVPNEKGFSMFPGNINVLFIKLDSYVKILEQTNGIVAEFVNPKYADEEKTVFKKPTRLETMMQDLPKLFNSGEKVGVTIFDRVWCFSADKNKVDQAAEKYKAGGPPESAASSESDFYLTGRMKAEFAGMEVVDAKTEEVLGIPFTYGPKIFFKPSFALTLEEVKKKIIGGAICDEATLFVDGNVTLKNIKLSGKAALIIKAAEGVEVEVDSLELTNDGLELVKLTDEELASDETPEYLKIRGYYFNEVEPKVYDIIEPGKYKIDAKGNLIRC